MGPPMKDMIEYTFPVTVEFEDVDSYRIAHHTKVIAFLERARVHMLADMGLDLSPGKTHMVLYNLSIRYIKRAKLRHGSNQGNTSKCL